MAKARKARVTIESIRLRLMELHPDCGTSVSIDLWSHGNVHVNLSAHPKELKNRCWAIYVCVHSDDRPLEARKAEALARALELAEAGKWEKPLEPGPELAVVHAG